MSWSNGNTNKISRSNCKILKMMKITIFLRNHAIMRTIKFLAFDVPNRNFIAGIQNRAQKNIDFGIITAIPVVTYKSAIGRLWSVSLEVPDCDRGFWLGFCNRFLRK